MYKLKNICNTTHSALPHHFLLQRGEVSKHLFKVINGLRPVNLKDYRNTSGNDKCLKRLFNTCYKFFRYPSPDAHASTSPSRDEVTRLLRCARNDIHCLGRSMIEMLGVLAIVGVLSVGGIAGYSKAMTKFKINKAIDEVNTIVANTKTLFANSKTIKSTNGGWFDPEIEEEDFEFMRNFIMPEETNTSVKNKYGGNMFQNPFGGEIYANPSEEGIIVYLSDLPREACIALGSYDWKDAESVDVSSISKGEAAYISSLDCQSAKRGIDVGPSYDREGIVGRCKYNNDILPMSPDLAAKGCSCTSNTCQFSVMFP